MNRRIITIVIGAVLPLVINAEEKAFTKTLTVIPLPAIEGGFNHMSVDEGRGRLFVTAPSNKSLEIIDLKNRKLWKSLVGQRPAAALFAPEFNQLYVADGEHLCIYEGES